MLKEGYVASDRPLNRARQVLDYLLGMPNLCEQ